MNGNDDTGSMKKAVSINENLLEQVSRRARESPRMRMNHNFHRFEDPVNRMLNAIEPESYIRPHRHLHPPLDETFLVLRGLGAAVLFDDNGNVSNILPLDPQRGHWGVDIPAGWFHTILALETETVFYEIKAGPFDPSRPKDLALFELSVDYPATQLRYVSGQIECACFSRHLRQPK